MKSALKFALKVAATLIVLLVGSSLLSTSPAWASGKTAPVAATRSATPTLPTRPCRDDFDDRDCFWDAGKRGNGKGYSYWVDRAGSVTYLDPRLNVPAKRKAWEVVNKAAKRTYWGTAWGHRLCWAKVGETSYIYCFDGFKETS